MLVGARSTPITATLANAGTAPATDLSFSPLNNGFAVETNTCGASVAVGASCEVSVTFTPAAAGPVDAALTVESAEGATATLDLSGTTPTFRYDFAEGATGFSRSRSARSILIAPRRPTWRCGCCPRRGSRS